MKRADIIFIFLIACFITACDKKKGVITVEKTFTETVDDPGPPPDNLVSKFKTVSEWLGNICDGQKPVKPISTYEFGLFQSMGKYTVYMVGINKYEHGDSSSVRIEFEPVNAYFPLPQNEYSKFKYAQVMEKLAAEIKIFTTTEKFRNSFLSNAMSINAGFNGKEIWRK
jgi:hypothetical protein